MLAHHDMVGDADLVDPGLIGGAHNIHNRREIAVEPTLKPIHADGYLWHIESPVRDLRNSEALLKRRRLSSRNRGRLSRG